MQLAPQHATALDWFVQRSSQTIGWPAPLDGLFLANKAKGIHKPAGWEHALSIRLTLDGPYVDDYQASDDGGWELDYNQEGADPSYFTNRALLACMRDAVPVAVLKQTRSIPTSEYLVLGLGVVVGFANGKFTIRSHISDSPNPASSSPFLEEFDSTDREDRRKFRVQSIAARDGQPAFRSQLEAAYGGACAVSGCPVLEALEAAHILFYRGVHTNHVKNGVLLRADIHSLFDIGLIGIDADYRVTVDDRLLGTEYARYHQQSIRLPADHTRWPDPGALKRRANEHF